MNKIKNKTPQGKNESSERVLNGACCLSVIVLIATPIASAQTVRVEQTEYHHNISRWILGQSSRQVVNGVEAAEIIYDGVSRPTTLRSFGRTVQVIGYNQDGTVNSVQDGNGHTTTLGAWKRGLPQIIQFPATPDSPSGASRSAVVSDLGLVSSVTDEEGITTSYQYDAMGRLSGIHYPEDDMTLWNSTNRAFEQVSGDEWGIPAGHWRLVVSTGTGQKVTYFDAMWRPLLIREFDSSDEVGTQRFTRYEYDHEGRVTFESSPSESAASSLGTRTLYDTLGRVVSASQDSELGPLTTTTQYLAQLRTLATSPKGVQTLTRYLAWNEPTFDYPVGIEQGVGTASQASIDLDRDSFGKPLLIRKRDPSSGHSIARQYVYDTHQRLCKSVEPETGATLMAYDGADNLVWSAAGHQDLLDTSQCNAAEGFAGGRRVDRTYDARGRVLTVRFPDGLGNTDNWYTPTGRLSQAVVDNGGVGIATTVYTHNKRGMVVGEAMGVGEVAWGIGYGYDVNGHLTSHTHSLSERRIDYAPNALGQASQAGAYALGAAYSPNGALKQFSYGNGVLHALSQNLRGLPERSQDLFGGAAVYDDSMDYDAHGNVAAISDGRAGNRGDRTMEYDALDRLIQTVSPMFGSATYTYDALDNLTSAAVSGGPYSRQSTYVYDSNNRLSSVLGATGNVTANLSYDHQGNLSGRNGQSYQFDYGNRLRSAVGVENYRYDAHGRRVHSIRGGGGIYSIYGNDGVLRFQRDELRGVTNEYIYLAGRQVARIEAPISLGAPQLFFPELSDSGSYSLSWTSVTGATRYELEEHLGADTWSVLQQDSNTFRDFSGRQDGLYEYRVRACDGSSCGIWSATATVIVEIPAAPTLLVNAVPLRNLSGDAMSLHYYTFDAQAVGTLSVTTTGGSGDVELYVKYGSMPTVLDYDAKSSRTGNAEAIRFSSPRAGRYYILMLGGPRAFSNLTLQARQSSVQ